MGFPNFSWDRPQWGEKPVPGFFWSVDDRPDSVPTDQDGFIQETNLTAGHRVDGIWFLHVVGATEDKIPGQRAMHFRFQILSEAKVAGIVLQKDGKTPVVGLGLRVEGAPGSWITKTDTHGKFDFGSLPVADLRLSTKMEDRPPLTLELPAGHSEIANLMLNDELVIFPAVVRDGSFSLYYHMPRKGLVILEVYDPHGHVVIHREVERPGGNFLRLQCDASKYPEGDYTLKIMARFEDGNTPRISLRKFTIKK